MRCMTSVRFNMIATVLNDYSSDSSTDANTEVKGGHWESYQDEDSGELSRRWVEDTVVPVLPGRTPTVNINRFDIECYARGFPEVGFRSSANTESYLDGLYSAFEAIQMTFPAKYVLNRSQYITNIRGRNKQILWLEEETGLPTIFEVQGVTPTFGAFGEHVANLAVLKRAENQ